MKIDFGNKLSDKSILVIGIVFIVTGVSVGSLTWHSILTREQTLYDPNLSADERWQAEGSIRWWIDLSLRLSYPLATVFLIGGLLAIALSHPFGSEQKESEDSIWETSLWER